MDSLLIQLEVNVEQFDSSPLPCIARCGGAAEIVYSG